MQGAAKKAFPQYNTSRFFINGKPSPDQCLAFCHYVDGVNDEPEYDMTPSINQLRHTVEGALNEYVERNAPSATSATASPAAVPGGCCARHHAATRPLVLHYCYYYYYYYYCAAATYYQLNSLTSPLSGTTSSTPRWTLCSSTTPCCT
jgi:hypothetical protein